MRSPVPLTRRLASNLARAARRGVARRSLPRDEPYWVCLELSGPIDELPTPEWGRTPHPSLLEVLQILEAAAAEPRVAGVLLQLHGGPGGLAKAESLRRGIAGLRAAGTRCAVFAESLDAESLLVASAADRIWVPESGRVFVIGVSADAFYLRELLEKVDVRPEVVRIGTHKTAGESLTHDHMSDAQREQLGALLDDSYEAIVSGIARGRGLGVDAVRDAIDRGPFSAREAVDAGWIDGCVYRDELEERVVDFASRASAAPGAPAVLDARVLIAARAAWSGLRQAAVEMPRIAYVVTRGAIHGGRGGRGIGSRSLEELLEQLRRDPAVRGAVLRIDSPGGDAIASDLIWRSVQALAREKPVVASLAEVAASGGYYMASAADAIFAEAASVTGSIGVIGGKLDLSGLYRRLGIGRDSVERGARAGMLTEARGFTDDERETVRGEMQSMYRTFLERVSAGRGLSVEEVDRVGQGRVWSGRRARELGLVDSLGGPLEALGDARRRAGLTPGEPTLVELHPRLPRLPGLVELLRWLS